MSDDPLLQPRPEGLWCPAGGFYVDPLLPVARAVLSLDGEILAWHAAADLPRPFTALQKRIGKLKPGAHLLAGTPVRFMAYDLLELGGGDLRRLAAS